MSATHFPKDYTPEYPDYEDDRPVYHGVNEHLTYAVLWRCIWISVVFFFCIFMWEGLSAGYGPDLSGWVLMALIIGVPWGWTMWAIVRASNNIDSWFFGRRG